jgi:hypothetical protein
VLGPIEQRTKQPSKEYHTYPEQLLEHMNALLDRVVIGDTKTAALAIDFEHDLYVGILAPKNMQNRIISQPTIEFGNDGIL